MARRPNYGFQKQQQEMRKQKKREEKEEKKRVKQEEAEGVALPADTQNEEDS